MSHSGELQDELDAKRSGVPCLPAALHGKCTGPRGCQPQALTRLGLCCVLQLAGLLHSAKACRSVFTYKAKVCIALVSSATREVQAL